MPTKPMRPCNHPGCPELTQGGFCNEHRRDRWQSDEHRETAAERGYDWEWAEFSRRYKRKHPLCQRCNEQGIKSMTQIPHHITPLAQGGEKYDEDNLMPLCRDCHSEIHRNNRGKHERG